MSTRRQDMNEETRIPQEFEKKASTAHNGAPVYPGCIFMSVYTPVNNNDLQWINSRYELGEIHKIEGILAGIQNSNYFLYASRGEFVLTVFEDIDHLEAERCMRLMHFLAEHAVPSSDPLPNRDGAYVEDFHGKPLALVKRVAGHSVLTPNNAQLRSIAHALGKWHVAASDYPERWPPRYDANWRQQAAQQVMPHLTSAQAGMLQSQLEQISALASQKLPHGIIHSDLFRDNCLFCGDKVSGIIDIYDANYAPLLYDLAVLINDWCCDESHRPDLEKARFVIACYQEVRHLTADEIANLLPMLRMAATRFWLSRLQATVKPKDGELALQKNPEEFESILIFWMKNSSLLL